MSHKGVAWVKERISEKISKVITMGEGIMGKGEKEMGIRGYMGRGGI